MESFYQAGNLHAGPRQEAGEIQRLPHGVVATLVRIGVQAHLERHNRQRADPVRKVRHSLTDLSAIPEHLVELKEDLTEVKRRYVALYSLNPVPMTPEEMKVYFGVRGHFKCHDRFLLPVRESGSPSNIVLLQHAD